MSLLSAETQNRPCKNFQHTITVNVFAILGMLLQYDEDNVLFTSSGTRCPVPSR